MFAALNAIASAAWLLGVMSGEGTSPPVVTIVSGPPTDLWLDITEPGGLGVAFVRYSTNDGADWSADENVMDTLSLGGFELTFADGDYYANNLYKRKHG